MKKMITKALILSCLFLTSIFIRANDTIPHGKWEVSQVTIEKNIDGKHSREVYKDAKVQNHIPCPQTWEIRDVKTIKLKFSDETEVTTEYVLKEDTMTIIYHGAIMKYQCIVTDNDLTLTITKKYQWNTPSGHVEQIEEKWVINLIKKE